MEERTYNVLRGFANLDERQKKLFIQEIRNYERLFYQYEKDNFKRRVTEKASASIGPKSTICDCCGR